MLKEMFLKKMASKKKLDPNEQEAKLGVVKELSKQASSMLSEKSKPKAKVEVAADSKEGLKMGLDKAKEVLGSKIGDDSMEEESEGMEGSPGEESSESVMEADKEKQDAMEVSEEEQQLSADELDEKIKKLIDLKKSKEPKEASKKINPFA